MHSQASVLVGDLADHTEHTAHHWTDGLARPDGVELYRTLWVGVELGVAATVDEVFEDDAFDMK
jgi:hypothetical protein